MKKDQGLKTKVFSVFYKKALVFETKKTYFCTPKIELIIKK